MTAEYILIKKYNSSQDVTEITETESNNSNKFLYSLSEIFLFSKILYKIQFYPNDDAQYNPCKKLNSVCGHIEVIRFQACVS